MGGSEQPDGPTRTELIEAFLAVVNAFTPEATIVALRAHADVLKSDGIEAIFSDAAAKYSDNPEAAGILEHRRQLLRFYRQFGMVGAEAALGPDPAPEVAAAVLRVAAAANWRDKLAALKTDASLIATPAGSRAALVLAWRNFENPDAVSEIQRTQGLLEMAVERGVDATIAHITERVARPGLSADRRRPGPVGAQHRGSVGADGPTGGAARLDRAPTQPGASDCRRQRQG